MEFRHLGFLSAFLCLALVGYHVQASLPAEDYWKSLWPNTPMPKALKDLTQSGAGLLKLQDDVQTCEYSDVQVMWEILQRTESEVIDKCHKRKQLPFWRIFVWSNHHEASSQSAIKQT